MFKLILLCSAVALSPANTKIQEGGHGKSTVYDVTPKASDISVLEMNASFPELGTCEEMGKYYDEHFNPVVTFRCEPEAGTPAADYTPECLAALKELTNTEDPVRNFKCKKP